MIKKSLRKDMTNFLQILNKLLSKKKRQINKSKQKPSIEGNSLKKTIIKNLDSINKKKLSVSVLKSKNQI